MVYLDRRLSDQDKRNKLCVLCVFAVKGVFSGVLDNSFIYRKGAEGAEIIIYFDFC